MYDEKITPDEIGAVINRKNDGAGDEVLIQSAHRKAVHVRSMVEGSDASQIVARIDRICEALQGDEAMDDTTIEVYLDRFVDTLVRLDETPKTSPEQIGAFRWARVTLSRCFHNVRLYTSRFHGALWDYILDEVDMMIEQKPSTFDRCTLRIASLEMISEEPDDTYIERIKAVRFYADRLAVLLWQLTTLHAESPDDDEIARMRFKVGLSYKETRSESSDSMLRWYKYIIEKAEYFIRERYTSTSKG